MFRSRRGLLLAAAAVAVFVTVPCFGFIRGDADDDGLFNGLVDALFILAYQFSGGAEPPCFDAADADDDGTVSGLVDGLYILQHQFQGGPPPPPPFPDDGGDPTADSLPDCELVPGGFATLAQGNFSGLADGTYLVRTEFEWVDFWALHASGQSNPPAMPSVDFTTDIVVAAVREFPNGSHEVTITSLSATPLTTNIIYTLNDIPGPCPQLILPNQPHHIVVWENAATVPDDTTVQEVLIMICP